MGQHDHRAYLTLDGLRGIAALAVAILHMPRIFGGFTVPQAHLAVDFFLQLSGFVLAYAYSQKIADGLTLREFMWLRFNRLYPVFIVGIAIGVVVAFVSLEFPKSGLTVEWTAFGVICSGIQNSLMLPAVGCGVGDLLFPTNPPMWSIFHELLINAIFFLFVCLLWSKTRLAILTSVLLALLPFIAISNKGFDFGFGWSDFLPGALRIAASFFIGVSIFNFSKLKTSNSDFAVLVLAAMVGALLLFQGRSTLFELVAVMFAFPLVVIFAAAYNPRSKFVGAACRYLGASSYVLYAIHKPTYQLMYGFLKKFHPSLIEYLGVAAGIMMLAVIFTFALLLAIFYEPAARRWLSLMAGMAKPKAASASVRL